MQWDLSHGRPFVRRFRDITKIVVFPLSDNPCFVTGTSIVADGGNAGVDYFMKKENDSLG